MKKVFLFLTVSLFVAVFAAPAMAKNSLLPGESLTPGHHLTSKNGKYIFDMQRDGNIVVYKIKNGRHVLWSSGTSKYNVTKLIMQSDGNLVMYLYRHASWSTGTSGNPGVFLIMQNDGNAVIYSNTRKKAIWSTNTAQ